MTNHTPGIKFWSVNLHEEWLANERKNYSANDGTQLPRHSHQAYIRGWCDWLDSWDNGFANFHNPYSRYYLTGAHDSWEAGRSDAANYLAGL